MKLIALCQMQIAGEKVPEGGEFEASEYGAAKLIARGAAKPASKPKKKKKAKTAEE